MIGEFINKVFNNNCLDGLPDLPDKSVNCCVTSPPYYGLRDYGTGKWVGGDEKCPHYRIEKNKNSNTGQRNVSGSIGNGIYKEICGKCGAIRVDEQIGLEKTPEKYVEKLVEVFSEVKRVLRDDGTLWLNLGDCYNGSGKAGSREYAESKHTEFGGKFNIGRYASPTNIKNLKPKDLIGIPWMVAFALRDDGWYLRQDIIWHKRNPMPESVKDRPTKSHEYIFLMSKSKTYYYDAEAISTEVKENTKKRYGRGWNGNKDKGYPGGIQNNMDKFMDPGNKKREWSNKKSVWTVNTKPYKEAHFAVYPEKLIVDCIKAGCPEGGIVLDPFMGAYTTACVARKLNRNYTGFELNPEYTKIGEKRLYDEIGIFQ